MLFSDCLTQQPLAGVSTITRTCTSSSGNLALGAEARAQAPMTPSSSRICRSTISALPLPAAAAAAAASASAAECRAPAQEGSAQLPDSWEDGSRRERAGRPAVRKVAARFACVNSRPHVGGGSCATCSAICKRNAASIRRAWRRTKVRLADWRRSGRTPLSR